MTKDKPLSKKRFTKARMTIQKNEGNLILVVETNDKEVFGRPIPRDSEDRRGAYTMISLANMTTVHNYTDIREIYLVSEKSKLF